MIHVVSAFIIRDGRMLLQQRLPKRDFPLAWESPGGKIEPTDRSPEMALYRELAEELDVRPDPERLGAPSERLVTFKFRAGEHGLKEAAEVTFYRVHVPALWYPKNIDAAGIGWFTIDEACSLDLIPGNEHLMGFLHRLTPEDALFTEVWGTP